MLAHRFMGTRRSFVMDYMIQPLAALMPSVRRTDRAVAFHRRILYTGLSVFVFMVCRHLPLYGVVRYDYGASGADEPLYWVRSILASERGTFMDLGVGPVLTAGTVLQLLAASKLIRVDQNVRRGRDLMNGARKVVAMAIALGEAASYVLLGMYGPVGALNGALIVLQLFSANLLVVFLDELLEKGYGLKGCSAIYLLPAATTCGKVVWQAFSPVTVDTGRGPEFEGIVLAVIHQLAVVGNTRALVVDTMLRGHLPNVTNLLATCVVLLTAVYLDGVHMLLPLQSWERRGRRHTFAINLLYNSTMPIFLYAAMVSALYVVSQLLHYSRFGGGVLSRLLGVWKWKEASYAAVPVGGLAYYVTPPSRTSVAADPLRALIYTVLLLASCVLLSRFWVIASRSSARDVARQLAEHHLAMRGGRHGAAYSQLKRYIPTAAAAGGLCVGALSIFADMTGAIGTGTGIMLAATVVHNLVNFVHT